MEARRSGDYRDARHNGAPAGSPSPPPAPAAAAAPTSSCASGAGGAGAPRLADYVVVAGVSSEPTAMQDSTELDELLPITDIAVIFASENEVAPLEYQCIERTASGQYVADLNHGSFRSNSVFLCFRRGLDKPPLLDIGVLYADKQRIMSDSEVLQTTPYGRPANVNNSSSKIFLTYRRAPETAPCNLLVVKDICVILSNKDETPPHAFCKIDQNLNKGVIGSDVYICYKKSVRRPPLILYRPETLLRFPAVDKRAFPLPQEVHLFCLPLGATVEKWRTQCDKPLPQFYTFVFTSQAATRAYGASLNFYEPYDNPTDDEIRQLGGLNVKTDRCYATKSICLVSRWPFFRTFRRFLQFLYHQATSSRPGPNSIEQYILHFLYNIPVPSVSRPRVIVPLNDDVTLPLRHLTDTALPMSGASFLELLCNLGPDNAIVALLLVLTENKILIHSLRPHVVTCVAEALVAACFPLRWQCPFVPLCPLGVSELMMAPLPFLAGVDSRYFDLHELPADVVCVDLDTNSLFIPRDKQLVANVRMMPKRAARKLRNALYDLYQRACYFTGQQCREIQASIRDKIEADFVVLRKERDLDLLIQEAFLRFMVDILRDFRQFLRPVTEKPRNVSAETLFDVDNFMRSRDKNYQQFYDLIVRTQMFSRLVEERSFLSENDQSLAFFDQCCDLYTDSNSDMSDVALLHIEAGEDNHTAYIAPPEPPQDPQLLKFRGWHKLNFPAFSDMFIDDRFVQDGSPLPAFSTVESSNNGGSGDDVFMNAAAHRVGGNGIVTDSSNYINGSSPVIKRTKHEVKSAIRCARQLNEVPARWGRALLSACYSVWFVHLPAYLSTLSAEQRAPAVRMSFQILCEAQLRLRHSVDEVCYRVVLSQCALMSQPALAVKVLMEMKRRKLIPNAMTYAYYNKAVMASAWPQSRAWRRLRNVILGVAQFKTALRGAYHAHGGSSSGVNHSGPGSVAASTNSLEVITQMSSTLSLTHAAPTAAGTASSSRRTGVLRDQGSGASSESCCHIESAGLLMLGSASRPTTPHRATSSSPAAKSQSHDTISVIRRAKSSIVITMEREIKEETAFIKFKTLPPSVTLLEQPREFFAKNVSPSLQRMGNYGSGLLQSFQRSTRIRRFSGGLPRQPDSAELRRPNSSPTARQQAGVNAGSNSASSGMDVIRSMASRLTSIINTADVYRASSGGIPSSRSLDHMFNRVLPSEVHNNLSLSRNGSANDFERFNQVSSASNASSLNDRRNPVGVILITMTSCCQCVNCKSLVYDEEIMSGWTADDSNLKTKCWCNATFVPQLCVTIKDRRALKHSQDYAPPCGDFTVPYLSPLVLQKEVENVLEGGNDVFTRPTFVDEHPIIYWNLMWYFKRLNLPTHITQICASSGLLRKGLHSPSSHNEEYKNNAGFDVNGVQYAAYNSQQRSYSAEVRVRTMWDNTKLHDCVTPPLYTIYKPGDLHIDENDPLGFKRAGRSVLDCMKSGSDQNVRDAVLFLMHERQKWKFKRNPSIYRELLFLLILEFGANIINPDWLDCEYQRVYEEVSITHRNLIFQYDRHPDQCARFARRYFGDLDLL